MKKGLTINNPAEALIKKGTQKKQNTKKPTTPKQEPIQTLSGNYIPKGKVLAEEPKTRRLQSLLKQSVYDELKARAETEALSVNELINRILEKELRG